MPKLIAKADTKTEYKIFNNITLILLGLALFYSVDLSLVKHFFSAYDAGLYSAASLYGKVLIFSAIPIAMVLLPHSIEAHIKRKDSLALLKKALMLLSIFGLPLLAFYAFLPELLIFLTLGENYINASSLLLPYGLCAMLISIAYIESFYIISIKKEKELWLPALLIWTLEPTLIIFNHSSLHAVLAAFLISSALLVLILSIYIFKLRKAAKLI